MKHKKFPVDRAKVIIGLECCRDTDPERCEQCPYYIVNCIGLPGDALKYIYWLEELVSIQEKEIKTLRGAILEIKDCATAALLTHAQE